jgi:hypothetical protein
MQEINLSQSGLAIGRIDSVPSLSSLAADAIAEHLFSKEQARLGLSAPAFIERLYVLPDSAVPCMVDALRKFKSTISEEVSIKIAEYVLETLSRSAFPSEFTPEADRFAEAKRAAKRTNCWRPQDEVEDDALRAQLRAFAVSEYLSLSRAEHFDTIFLTVVGAWVEQIPTPSALPRLRSLFVRDGMYDVSMKMLKAADSLRTLTLESDEFVREQLLEGISASPSLECVVFRSMSGGDSDVHVTQAMQRLGRAQLRDLEFYACNFAFASVCGFLLKRLERLQSFGLCCVPSIPTSVASSVASCERLTRVSFRECTSLNEGHLVPLASGAHHIRHLILSATGMDYRKLFKFAEALGKQENSVLEILDLSELKDITLSSVVAVMKAGTPALRHLLLEDSVVNLVSEKDVDRKAAQKVKAKNKRIGSGKAGGGGAKGKGKAKKKGKGKEEDEKQDGDAVVAVAPSDGEKQKKKKKKKKWSDEEVDQSKLKTSVTSLTLSGSKMSDWVGAQLVGIGENKKRKRKTFF